VNCSRGQQIEWRENLGAISATVRQYSDAPLNCRQIHWALIDGFEKSHSGSLFEEHSIAARQTIARLPQWKTNRSGIVPGAGPRQIPSSLYKAECLKKSERRKVLSKKSAKPPTISAKGESPTPQMPHHAQCTPNRGAKLQKPLPNGSVGSASRLRCFTAF
jgi:hypothetical protein